MRKILYLIAILLGVGGAAAQNPNDFVTDSNSTGVLPFRSYAGARENIDLKNLNVNIVIPLFTLSGRNGMDVEVVVAYNSIVHEWIEGERGPTGDPTYRYDFIPAGGSDFFELQIAPRLFHLGDWYQSNGQSYNPNRYLVRLNDGTRHDMLNKDYDTPVSSGIYNTLERMRSTDGSFVEFRETTNNQDGILYFKNGTQMNFVAGKASWIRDTNGNMITYDYNQTPLPGATSREVMSDSLNRKIDLNYYSSSKRTDVSLLDTQGTAIVYSLMNAEVPITGSPNTRTELRLPTYTASNNQRYLFEWANVGPLRRPDTVLTGIYDKRLVKITYPTGGYTRYEWVLAFGDTKTQLSRKCISADGTTESCWNYTYGTTVTRPDGSYTRHTFILERGQESRTEYFSAGGVLMRRVDRDWIFQRDVPLLTRETTTLENNLVSKVEYDYDDDGYVWGGVRYSNGNVETVREYAYGTGAAGALTRRTTRTWLWNTAMGTDGLRILDRMTQETVYDGAAVQKSRVTNYYDVYTSPRTLIAVTGALQRDSAFGTTYQTRGNLSRVSRWVTGSTNLDTWYRYDICGNVREQTDPKSFTTLFNYAAATQFAYPGQVTDPLGFVVTRAYSFFTNSPGNRGFGLITSETDPNGNVTNTAYDRYGRMKSVSYPDTGGFTRYYSDTELTATHNGSAVFRNQTNPPAPRVKTYTKLDTGVDQVELTLYDGLGRISITGNSNGSQMDFTRTEYDGNDRVRRVSNPRTLTPPTGADVPTNSNFTRWSATTYDGLDRVTLVTLPDGQTISSSYAGNNMTVTDPVNSKIKSTSDALGRLVTVVENNPDTGSITSAVYTTTYTYDVMNNLTQVNQDAITRTFVYDGAGRMTSETHPEWGATSSGTTSYGYDANSNMTSRTDPRSVSTTYAYDALNRVTSVTYSDSTPTLTFSYDNVSYANARGRRTRMVDGVGTTTYDYDKMGRIARQTWSTAAFSNQVSEFDWTVGGRLKKAKYPGVLDYFGTPLRIEYGYDNSGRQISAFWTNDGGSFQQLVSSSSFTYNGTNDNDWAREVTGFANGTTETITYNVRLQPIVRSLIKNAGSVSLVNHAYSFARQSDQKNNGSLFAFTDNSPSITGKNVTYGYDFLKRIKTATGSGWTMTFTIDKYGNRTNQASTGGVPSKSLSIPSRNRIQGTGYAYDSAGNMTSEPGFGYQYDAENKIKSVTGGAAATYNYDGDGRRARKVSSAGTRYYVYDALGDPAWEYKVGASYPWETFNFFFNAKHVLTNSGVEGLRWRHLNHLGNLMAKIDSAAAVRCRNWYFPYGELTSDSTCVTGDTRLFTGKERDPETGLDYFGARYYGSWLGRFTSVDPGFAGSDPANPQSWNGYAYTLNNPLKYVDPDGESATLVGAAGGAIVGGAVAWWRGESIANGAISGAVAGALAGAVIDTGGAALGVYGAAALGGAVGGVGGGVVGRALEGQETTLGDVAQDAAVGAAFGVGGAAVGQAVTAVGQRLAGPASRFETLRPGQFAGDSIELSGPGRNFTAGQRAAVNEIGKCHTCGTTNPGTKSGNMVIDHQPASALKPNSQRGYPQCLSCSNRQGGQTAQQKKIWQNQQEKGRQLGATSATAVAAEANRRPSGQ